MGKVYRWKISRGPFAIEWVGLQHKTVVAWNIQLDYLREGAFEKRNTSFWVLADELAHYKEHDTPILLKYLIICVKDDKHNGQTITQTDTVNVKNWLDTRCTICMQSCGVTGGRGVEYLTLGQNMDTMQSHQSCSGVHSRVTLPFTFSLRLDTVPMGMLYNVHTDTHGQHSSIHRLKRDY